MDGQRLTFEVLLATSHSEKDLLVANDLVSMLTVSGAVYACFHSRSSEIDHRSSLHYKSFQYFSLVSQVVLIDLSEQGAALEPGVSWPLDSFIMMVMDGSVSGHVLVLKADASEKLLWFRWISYLQYLGGASFPFVSVTASREISWVLVEGKNLFPLPSRQRSEPKLINRYHFNDTIRSNNTLGAWDRAQEENIKKRLDKWNELLFKCEELQKLLDARRTGFLAEVSRRDELNGRCEELISKMKELKEFHLLVDRGDSSARAEWRHHVQTFQVLYDEVEVEQERIDGIRTKREEIMRNIGETREGGNYSLAPGWAWAAMLLIASLLILQVIFGLFSL